MAQEREPRAEVAGLNQSHSRSRSVTSMPGSFHGSDEDDTAIPAPNTTIAYPGMKVTQENIKTPETDNNNLLQKARKYRDQRDEIRRLALEQKGHITQYKTANEELTATVQMLEERLMNMEPLTKNQPTADTGNNTGNDTSDRGHPIVTTSPDANLAATWRPKGTNPTKPLSGDDLEAYKPWRYQVDEKLDTDYPLYQTERRKISYAISQMTQPIFSSMQGWVADNPGITYLDLMDEIEHYMGLHLQGRQAKKELQNIKQRPGEGITEYYHRIRTLWQKASIPEDERIDKLLTTMRPSLSSSLLSKNYTKVRSLLDDARTVEDRRKDIQFNYPRNHVTHNADNNNGIPSSRGGNRGQTSNPNSNTNQSTSTSSSGRTQKPTGIHRNAKFGPVAHKPNGWIGDWYDPVLNPKKLDDNERASLLKQGRCWSCRGSGHRSADSVCPNRISQEHRLAAITNPQDDDFSSSGEETEKE